MSYYKITIESHSIKGLKAIQGNFLGHGASAADSTTLETPVPPPPPQQVEANLDAFSGVVPAPPPTANEAGDSLDFSDENAYYPPPPRVADSATMDIGLEGDIPPPPKDELQGQEGNEAQSDEGVVPPQQSAPKSSNAAKKSSK